MIATHHSKMELLNGQLSMACACLQQLQTLLMQEHDTLQSHDAPLLEKLAESKLLCLKRLEKCQSTIASELKMMGLPDLSDPHTDVRHKMDQFFDSLDQTHGATLKKQWLGMEKAIREVSELNLRNGLLINRARNTNKRLLDIMRGQTPDQNTYNAQGMNYNAPSQTASIRA